MERRLHPSHDRTVCRGVLGFVAAAVVAAGVFATGVHFAAEWVQYLGAGVFALAALRTALTRVNTCRCPTCGHDVRRPPDTTEFPCERCRIVWYARSHGFSLRD